MKTFVSNYSDVKTKNIGENTLIWQFVVILKGAVIGSNVNICSNCFIESDVKIGNNVTIKNGVNIYNGIHIEDNVFIGPNVTFTNDMFPRSKDHSKKVLKTIIKSGASVGAGSVILPGLTIGTNAMIGAGSLVSRDIPDYNLAYGNPVKIIREIKY